MSSVSGHRQSPFMVELVGLPGVGKTTLAKTLCSHNQKIQLAQTPYFRNPADVPFYIRNTLRLLPLLLRIPSSDSSGPLKPRDIALMVILTGWSKTLKRQGPGSRPVLLLDEGPICYLTRLRAWGSQALSSNAASSWWKAMFLQWADILDQIVQLDTSDEILVERIRTRNVWQEVKAMSEAGALAYMQDLRAHQEYVLMEISAQANPPQRICFDTRQNSPEDIDHAVTGMLNRESVK